MIILAKIIIITINNCSSINAWNTFTIFIKFYESMKGNTDEKLWLKKLGATGYASDPNWPTTVYKVVLNKCH